MYKIELHWRKSPTQCSYIDFISLEVCVYVTVDISYYTIYLKQQTPSLARHDKSLKHCRRPNSKAYTYKHHTWEQWFCLRFFFCLQFIWPVNDRLSDSYLPFLLSLPSPAPRCSLEDCFGEHLEAGCLNRLHSCRALCSSERTRGMDAWP